MICNSWSITRRESPPVGIEPNFGRLDESSESRMSVDETGWAVDQMDQLFAVWCFVRESVQRRRVRAKPSVRREFANRFQLTANQLNCTVDYPVVLSPVRRSAGRTLLLAPYCQRASCTACFGRERIKSGRCCLRTFHCSAAGCEVRIPEWHRLKITEI